MKDETPFKGSPLNATLSNCSEDKIEFWYEAVKAAKAEPSNKGSIFWKEALELIENKYQRLIKKHVKRKNEREYFNNSKK